MGVELLQHAPYSVFNELLLVNRVDVEVVYCHFGYLQLAQRTVVREVDVHLRAGRKARHDSRCGGNEGLGGSLCQCGFYLSDGCVYHCCDVSFMG